MNDLASDITKWLMQRPAWQQEAVERQIKKGDLSDSDIDEIASMLKSSTGPIPSTPPNFFWASGCWPKRRGAAPSQHWRHPRYRVPQAFSATGFR